MFSFEYTRAHTDTHTHTHRRWFALAYKQHSNVWQICQFGFWLNVSQCLGSLIDDRKKKHFFDIVIDQPNLTFWTNWHCFYHRTLDFVVFKMLSIFRGLPSKITPSISVLSNVCSSNSKFHTSATLDGTPKGFLSYNDKVYPPQAEGETPRSAVSLTSYYNRNISKVSRDIISIFVPCYL